MNRIKLSVALGCLLATISMVNESSAQTNNYGVSQSQITNSFRRTQNEINKYTAQSTVLRRPTVSPYLRLAQARAPSAFQYQNVRQLLDRRAQGARQAQQLQLLSTQINSINRIPTDTRSGFTGHPTRYMAFSHYYGLVRTGP